jgi:hypothetical protein
VNVDRREIAERLGAEFADATKQTTITEQMILYARGKGISFVCANCTKFWKGIERGQVQCMALFERKQCGGPISGMTFPEYHGPLQRTLFPVTCFVCGAWATAGVKVDGSEELIGVCADHELWLTEMRKFDKNKDKQQPIIMKVRAEVPT